MEYIVDKITKNGQRLSRTLFVDSNNEQILTVSRRDPSLTQCFKFKDITQVLPISHFDLGFVIISYSGLEYIFAAANPSERAEIITIINQNIKDMLPNESVVGVVFKGYLDIVLPGLSVLVNKNVNFSNVWAVLTHQFLYLFETSEERHKLYSLKLSSIDNLQIIMKDQAFSFSTSHHRFTFLAGSRKTCYEWVENFETVLKLVNLIENESNTESETKSEIHQSSNESNDFGLKQPETLSAKIENIEEPVIETKHAEKQISLPRRNVNLDFQSYNNQNMDILLDKSMYSALKDIIPGKNQVENFHLLDLPTSDTVLSTSIHNILRETRLKAENECLQLEPQQYECEFAEKIWFTENYGLDKIAGLEHFVPAVNTTFEALTDQTTEDRKKMSQKLSMLIECENSVKSKILVNREAKKEAERKAEQERIEIAKKEKEEATAQMRAIREEKERQREEKKKQQQLQLETLRKQQQKRQSHSFTAPANGMVANPMKNRVGSFFNRAVVSTKLADMKNN
eukprot:TRINITY_DN2547_c0_g2_i1.p1 TRINITY_DN2547_c0_g2~~TRINITY_DN2547_c0_g2_i1.p1  ORF type:complete len:513 (+),score=131.03 TRINITY_DN2547_c0_g2_i1:53-1591(+)